jgi:hypothetical protein
MDLPPLRQQKRLVFRHEAHGLANLSAGHALSPDKLRGAEEIDLRMTVAKRVNVGRFVIVGKNDARRPDAWITVTIRHGNPS